MRLCRVKYLLLVLNADLPCFREHLGDIDQRLLVDLTDEGETVLHMAVERNSREAIDVILRYNVDIDQKTNSGNSAVAIAAYYGNIESLRLLVDNNASLRTMNEWGDWPVHQAAAGGHIGTIQYLFDNGFDVEVRNFKNMTPLHVASMCGKRGAARFLVDHGAHFEARGPADLTALHYAAMYDDVDLVRFFLKQGSDIEAKADDGTAALSIAAQEGHRDTVLLLLDYDANITAEDNYLWTPIHHAAYNGHQEVVEILLDKGADLAAETDGGSTALSLAIRQKHTAVADLLRHQTPIGNPALKYSMGQLIAMLISATKNDNVGEIARLVNEGVDVDLMDVNGRRATSVAAENGHEAALNVLINNKATPDLQDENGESPLWWAARHGHEKIVRTLLAQGVRVDAADSDGQTPLSVASQNGYEEIVRCLLEEGSNPNSSTSYGKTPLLFATANGYHRVTELLISNGADVDDSSQDKTVLPLPTKARDQRVFSKPRRRYSELYDLPDKEFEYAMDLISAAENGRLAEMMRLIGLSAVVNGADAAVIEAAFKGHDAAVRILIKHGAHVDSRDQNRETPLHLAARSGHIPTIKLLHQEGAELDMQNDTGMTPLSCASKNGEQKAVELLLELGANKEVKDQKLRTALWHAISKGHVGIVKALLDNGANIESANAFRYTTLTRAVFKGNRHLVKLLLERGACMRPESSFNCSPLYIASDKGSESLVELLIDHGADLNHRSNDGDTALIAASRTGKAMVVKILIEMGASVHIKNNDGRTALSYAKELNNEPIVVLLSQVASLRETNLRSMRKAEQEALSQKAKYKYRPLKEGYIRILELNPGERGDIISFELYDTDLTNDPSFEALSYEWKEKCGTIPVQCDGERLLVTPNCKTALERIRHHSDKRFLWIDAVCINQEDKQECNQQVAMMTEIYRKASSVLMWIGEGDNRTEAAFKHIPTLCRVFEALCEDPNQSSWSHFDVEERNDVQDLARDVMKDQIAVNGLKSLHSSEYFKRAWIFQEIMLAGTRGLVMCGEQQCRWEIFKNALIGSSYIGATFSWATSFYDIIVCHDQLRRWGQLGLIDTSQATTKFEASDARDKVFAALRLSSVKDRGLVKRPVADYTLTVQEVFVNTSRYFIEYHGDLEVWNLTRRPNAKSIPGLPSWVADFTQLTEGLRYNPFRDSITNYWDLIHGRPTTTPILLRVDGCLLDKVTFKISLTKEMDVYGIVKPMVLALAGHGRRVYDPYLGPGPGPQMKKRPATRRWRRRKRTKNFRRKKKVTGKSQADTRNDARHQITNGRVLLDTILDLVFNGEFEHEHYKQAATFLAWKLSKDVEAPVRSRKAPRFLRRMIASWEARSREGDDFDLEICYEMEDRARYDTDLVYTKSGYFGLTNKGEAEEGMWVAVVGGADDLVLLREKSSDGDGDGDMWYEFVDRVYLNHGGRRIEQLKDMCGDRTVRRLEIR